MDNTSELAPKIWINEDYCADPEAMWASIRRSFQERRAAQHPSPPMLTLSELRASCHFSQEQLAQTLRLRQTAISRLERRADMYVSSLKAYIEALGGSLDLVACFPAREVRVTL